MGYTRFVMDVSMAIAAVNFVSTSVFCSHLTTFLSLKITVKPPFWSLMTSVTVTSLGWVGSVIDFNASLCCAVAN